MPIGGGGGVERAGTCPVVVVYMAGRRDGGPPCTCRMAADVPLSFNLSRCRIHAAGRQDL